MSKYTRAGREHSQAASPGWPTERFYTIDVTLSIQTGVGWGAGTLFHLSILLPIPLGVRGVRDCVVLVADC